MSNDMVWLMFGVYFNMTLTMCLAWHVIVNKEKK